MFHLYTIILPSLRLESKKECVLFCSTTIVVICEQKHINAIIDLKKNHQVMMVPSLCMNTFMQCF